MRNAQKQPGAAIGSNVAKTGKLFVHITGKNAAGQRLPQGTGLPPAPWVNVIANPDFGCLISESGSACTWAGNSQANRLTPWSNDPVSDPPGEVIFIRDENTGEFWSPTWPSAGGGAALVRHGQGYTIFEHNSHSVRQEVLEFVALQDPIKFVRLKLKNEGRRPRRLSATFYAEWVLGTDREQTAMHIVTAVDPNSGAVLARNPFNTVFALRVAFADVDVRPRTFTTNRTEFLGRNGSLPSPRGLKQGQLSNTVGAGAIRVWPFRARSSSILAKSAR